MGFVFEELAVGGVPAHAATTDVAPAHVAAADGAPAVGAAGGGGQQPR
jgi:hypothetical protein